MSLIMQILNTVKYTKLLLKLKMKNE